MATLSILPRKSGKANRRILAAALAVLLGAAAAAAPRRASSSPARRPNVLLILTDQLQADMMSCAGNRFVKTPALDRLAARGARFELAYCANPVCLPSRVSLMTGFLPSRFGIRSNDDNAGPIPPGVLRRSLGWIFHDAGYETAYGGKTHWPRGMTPQSIGFDEVLTRDERDGLAEAGARFLEKARTKPFLLVASFIEPHDICYMAIDAYTRATHAPAMFRRSVVEREQLAAALRLPAGAAPNEFFARLCPPLPANYEIPALEPEGITTRYTQARPFREYARRHWSDQQWRLHRWAYSRLTELADAQIGRLLEALRLAGLENNTVIVFTSDHGDMNGAHRLEHKSILYEEAVRVPLIISDPGVTRPGWVDSAHLVSTGLDLIPTLCDFAGLQPPAGARGRSVRALAEGRAVASWRGEVVAESQDGRMIRSNRYKYNIYDSGAHREQLTDLAADPGETTNLAENPRCRRVLDEQRRQLWQWSRAAGDAIGEAYLIPPGMRSVQ